MQSRRQLVPIELRIVARTRNCAHIDQPFYIVRFKETLHKFCIRSLID
jgi:hypothetical protein